MGVRQYIPLYLLTAAIFFSIDLIWLGVVAKGFYNRYLGAFLSEQVNWPAGILFYLIYIAGILVFVVVPAIQSGSLMKAALMGGFLGIFAYATFDLTGLALFRGWPVIVVWVDMAWGMVLTGSVATLATWLGRRFIGP